MDVGIETSSLEFFNLTDFYRSHERRAFAQSCQLKGKTEGIQALGKQQRNDPEGGYGRS